MSAKHTPGPWEYHKCLKADQGFTEFQIRRAGTTGISVGQSVAWTNEGRSNDQLDEHLEADARLIASAPQLLSALKRLLFCCEHGNGSAAWDEVKDQSRAAITKAEGE